MKYPYNSNFRARVVLIIMCVLLVLVYIANILVINIAIHRFSDNILSIEELENQLDKIEENQQLILDQLEEIVPDYPDFITTNIP